MGEISYYCALCGKNRYVPLDIKLHKQRVKESPNGLVEITDIHYCMDGILSLNNLHVDSNRAVRSFSMMELPDKKRKPVSVSGIPLPSKQSHLNTYRITKMNESGGFRIRLIDDQLRVNLNIGEITNDEEVVDEIISQNGHVRLYYYPSDIKLRNFNRRWFQVLVDALEELPPTRLGLFIETLRYVYDQNHTNPGAFEIEQLRTLLTSHKTKFDVLPHNYKSIRNVTKKYGEDKREVIDSILQILEKQPDATLQDIQNEVGEDLIHLIFLSIILEVEGIVKIKRDFN